MLSNKLVDTRVILVLLTTLASRTSTAGLSSGAMCQPDASNSSMIKYDNRGARSINTSTTRERIWCPFLDPGTASNNDVALYVYDGNSNAGSSYQFECGLKVRTTSGTVYSSSVLYSSNGYQTLHWYQPFGGGWPPELIPSFSAYCYIPPSIGETPSYVIATFNN